MAFVPNSGSVVAFQGTVPWSVLGTITGSVAAVQSGTAITSISGVVNTAGSVVAFQGTSPWIITGSVQGSFTAAANQSVSGTVGASLIGLSPVSVSNFPITQNVSGSVVATQGTNPWIITGSVQATLSPAANQSVSGTVQVDVRGSVATVIIGGSIAASFTPPANQSVSGTVQTQVQASVAVVIIGGSILTSSTANQSVSGTVGASIIGLTPFNFTTLAGASVSSVISGVQKVGISDSLGQSVSAFPATFLRTSDEPHQLFYDAFDTAIDTTNRWTSTTGNAGVAAANTTGVMAMGTGTTANGFSKLASQPIFTLPIPAWLGVSDAIALPDGAAPTANSYRYWGTGTTPGSPTVAAPVTDGYGFELNTDGKLRAVVYAGGTRTVIQDLSSSGNSTQPLDAAYHRYIIYIRTDKAYWYIDGLTSAQLVATSNFQSSQVQSLPRLFLCVGNTVAPLTNTQIQCTGATAWDTGKNNVTISDGSFPYRKVTIKSSVVAAATTDTALVVALHPTTPLPSGTNFLGAVNASISGNVNVSGSVAAFQAGTQITSIAGTVPVVGSVNALMQGSWSASIAGTVSVLGTVPVTQSGGWVTSIYGGYAEDSTHTDGNIGVFTLAVRNDTVSSFSGTNLDYTPAGVDSAGRLLVKPFAAGEASVTAHVQTVSAGGGVGSVVLFPAAGAGLKNYITDFNISNTGATTTLVIFSDGDGSVLGRTIAPAGGGSNMPGMATPIVNIRPNTPITVVSSMATSILFVSGYGFKAP